jgi:uncharacterized membrane protein YfcA
MPGRKLVTQRSWAPVLDDVFIHIDPYIVLGSAIIGFLVGMTGAGGGALMTPMLILLFGVTPSAAISSDLVAAVVMRPIGAGVHFRRGAVSLAGRPTGPHER